MSHEGRYSTRWSRRVAHKSVLESFISAPKFIMSNKSSEESTKGENSRLFGSFVLRDKIASLRMSINSSLASLTATKESEKDDGSILFTAKKMLYDSSEYCQANYPYISTITRTHSPEIIAAYTIGTGLFSWKFLPKRYLVASTLSGFLYAEMGTHVINYKWKHPRNSDGGK